LDPALVGDPIFGRLIKISVISGQIEWAVRIDVKSEPTNINMIDDFTPLLLVGHPAHDTSNRELTLVAIQEFNLQP